MKNIKMILFASLITVLITSSSILLIPDSFASVYPQPKHIEIPINAFSFDCYQNNSCFVPPNERTILHNPVHVTNNDNYAHTMTSYYPYSNSTVFFDVTIAPGEKITLDPPFDKEGKFYYYCKLFPWMKGSFIIHQWHGGIGCLEYPDWYKQVIVLKDEKKISIDEYVWSFSWMHKEGLLTYCGY
ncbi:MAG: hypothetical protein J4F36_14470 [Nitrosopumilaceae archaeon]|nr:hypothetical protein [Nitrosopumilaceae archaeon]